MSSIVNEQVLIDENKVLVITEFDDGSTVIAEYSKEEYEAINGS